MCLRFISGMFLLVITLYGCAMPGPAKSVVTEVTIVSAALQLEYNAALASLDAGDYATAAARFEQFIRRVPDSPGAHVNLALAYLQLQQDDKAQQLLEQALMLDGEYVSALNQLGVLKRRRGDFGGAEQAWQQAIRVSPDYAYAWFNLGVLYDLYLQDLPTALEHYQRYQDITGTSGQDERVARWITDLQNRLGRTAQTAQARREI